MTDAEKDNFYYKLGPIIAEIPTSEILILFNDWNGHVGKSNVGYAGVHGWGTKNAEGKRLLEFAVSCNRAISNTCFKKRTDHLIIFTSGEKSAQTDYVLLRKTFCKHVIDAKVISGEEIAKQHHLLVCDFRAEAGCWYPSSW